MNSIFPSVFGRLFTPHLAVDINQQGLVINNKKHTDTLSWCDLTSPICYEYGVLGQTLRFSTQSGQYRVWMRAYGSHRILKAKTDQLWVNNNIEPLNELLENINQFAHHQFLRQSYVADIKQRVKQQYNRWLPWIKKSEALAVVSTQIKLLEQYTIKGLQDSLRELQYNIDVKLERIDDILVVHSNQSDSQRKNHFQLQKVFSDKVMELLEGKHGK